MQEPNPLVRGDGTAPLDVPVIWAGKGSVTQPNDEGSKLRHARVQPYTKKEPQSGPHSSIFTSTAL